MLIDWFTVAAQALNFLVLVWLLKRFLYHPILHAIDEREKRIAAALADADAKKADALKERDAFQEKNEAFDAQRAALLSQAQDAANAERRRMFEEARKAADALGARRQEALAKDARNLSKAIRSRTQQEVFAIARKALADLATTSLEERMADIFMRRLRELDGQTRADLAQALKAAPASALVRSAYDLPEEQRTAIRAAINETFAAQIDPRFEAAAHLVSGIELSVHGQKLAWSIADYLAALEEGVGELLRDKVAAQTAAPAEPPPPLPAREGNAGPESGTRPALDPETRRPGAAHP